ncbi:ATD2B protein, partial [Polypterus senegalus]
MTSSENLFAYIPSDKSFEQHLEIAMHQSVASVPRNLPSQNDDKKLDASVKAEMAVFQSNGKRGHCLEQVYQYLMTVPPTSVVKKHAIHSSDTTSSSDEERFERRKSKSMTRARNRCLPMNLRGEDLASGILRDRVKVGASLADVDPMTIDTAVRFDSVGGLGHHIQALKEMVVFPLLYPEVFERFKIQPPRGCLFYGPPGTGKTLVARALANECSQGDRKVSFFMRKGADCLSKWVGESERQLRLLFDQAYLMRPSIIFFDEIDGLAPVRSSRQDQIHSSIVSTLLALMDGLDNRGEIVVIGATNRLDSIDPALRRPGRFDREFLFNLPDKKARKHILKIHTRDWNPKLADTFLDELAEKCVGYCGADIKALCTEAALIALRRRYPQIYASSQKLQLDVSSIILSQQDFYYAMRNIVPASQRAVMSPGQALSPIIRPLLENIFGGILASLQRVFPHAELSQVDKKEDIFEQLLEDDIFSDDEVIGAPSIFDFHSHSGSPKKPPSANSHRPFLHFTVSAYHQPTSYRPRLLLAGDRGSGQSTHLAPAVLHSLEKFSVHRLDLPTLYSVSAKTPEESCAQVFREARRTVPCVVYMPMISEWWDSVNDMVRTTIVTLLQDIPSFTPILILATSEIPYGQLHEEVKSIFRNQYGEVVNLKRPNEVDRRKFFRDLILIQSARPPSRNKKAAMRALEVLLPAVPPPPRELSEEEKKRLADQEENTLRELRLFLRDVTKRLATDKRFNIFSKPVDIEEVSDYLEVIKQPMDLSTIMTKIDTHKYFTVKDFLMDIDLICSNALEYNPDKDPGDHIRRKVRRRPQWGRGIIRRRKYYLKKEGTEGEDSEPAEFGELEGTTDCHDDTLEEETADLSLTHDESSCDALELGRVLHSQNGPIAHQNGHLPSTEEESSNEPPVSSGNIESIKEDTLSRKPSASNSSHPKREDCINGDSSLDSLYSDVSRKSVEERELNSKEQSVELCSITTLDGSRRVHEGSFSQKVNSGKPEQGQMLRSTENTSLSTTSHQVVDSETKESDHEKEGASKMKKCRKSFSEQLKAINIDSISEEVVESTPPLIVNDERLSNLLQLVVNKTENFTVDQLERLYSLLSQCIYRHRRDYDKTHLTEVPGTNQPTEPNRHAFKKVSMSTHANAV